MKAARNEKTASEKRNAMTAESSTSNYYTFTSPNGDAAAWTASHKSYRAPSNAKAPRNAQATGTQNPSKAPQTPGNANRPQASAAQPQTPGTAATNWGATGSAAGSQTKQSAGAAQSEPVYVQAHIIDEKDTPFGRKTTWTNTGNNPSAGFRTSWTSSNETDAHAPHGSSKGSFVAGVVQTVAGVGLMAVGVPMLIFPGPGIAAIAGGAALAGSGIRKIVGRR